MVLIGNGHSELSARIKKNISFPKKKKIQRLTALDLIKSLNLSFDGVFQTPSFDENNRKINRIMHCVDFLWVVVEEMNIFQVFQLSFDGGGLYLSITDN